MKQKVDLTTIGGFRSAAARRAVQIGGLGFLGALGLVPGWERLLGFTGFFGFIGVGFIIETIYRIRKRNM
jgi:hypothetical protein